MLEGKARVLRESGKGKIPNKADSLTEAEVEVLWNAGKFGNSNGYSLTNTLWWLFTLHFGLRGRQEHHDMEIQHFTFKKDDHGGEYVTYAEGITKTRQSGLHDKHRLVKPKMFETGGERCPVALFKFFISKRPVEQRHSGKFYLAVIANPITDILFKKSPMGVNAINNIMQNMI